MKLKKLLAGFMTACMVATALPVTALACEPVDAEAEEDYSIMLLEEVDETADDVLTIATKDDLLAFAKDAKEGDNYSGKTVELTADIDLEWENWEAITFYGTFEGNGHTISNLTYVPTTSGRMGFFQSLGGPAKDLTLNNIKATVTNDYSDGARVAGFARYLNAAVENIHVKNIVITTKNTQDWVGGFTTYTAGGRTDNCSVTNLTVDATAGADLIAGFISLTSNRQLYENSTVNGFEVTVTDTHSSGCGVGGFVGQTQTGWNNPKFKNDVVKGIDITATGLVDVGGFIAWPGAHTEYAENCTTEGKIDVTGVTSAGCFAGGFFGNLGWNCDLGYQGHVVTDCTADVDIVTTVAAAGGFVGSATNSNDRSMYAEFTNCTAKGDITSYGEAPVGGFAGDADRGVYTNCTATGEVTGTTYAGGFIGHILDVTPNYDGRYPADTRDYKVDEITLSECTGSEDVTGADDKTAGLIGYIDEKTDVTLCGNEYEGLQYNPSTLTEEVKVVVATVTDSEGNETRYDSLQNALNDAAAGTGDVTVEILDDIDLTNVDWEPVTVSAPGYPMVTVNGNGKTITNLNDMLFAGTWAGESGLVIKDLTIKDSTIEHDVDDESGDIGVGAFIGYPAASAVVTLENCHLIDSTVKGGHWTGGLIGTSGGYGGTDGPVFMNLTIKDCSVVDSTIEGKGSVGAIMGHGALDVWTLVEIEDCTVTGNTITSNDDSDVKAGVVMGTIGAAGTEHTTNDITKTGGVYVDVTESNNTVTSNGVTAKTIYGRQGSSTGVLTITGGNATVYTDDIDNFVFIAEGLTKADNVVAEGTSTISEPAPEPEEPPTPSTSSSRKSSKKYDVEVEDTEDGTVKVSSTRAKKGETVTITVTPDDGYELDELVVLDSDGDEIEVKDKGNGKFTFVMPRGDVEIEASFEEADEPVVEDPAVDEKEENILILTIDQVIYQLNGEYLVNDVAPVIKGDRTMLPIRLIAEFLGATVTWNEAEQSVTIVNGDTEIVIYIDQAFALVNGEPVQLDAPAFIANDRTYLPVRFIAENLGATVTWDGTAQTVTIVSAK